MKTPIITRLYSDGYIIQGGLATGSYADEGSLNITFLKKFNKTPYIEISNYSNIDRDGFESHIKSYSTIGFNCFFNQASSSRGTKGFFLESNRILNPYCNPAKFSN